VSKFAATHAVADYEWHNHNLFQPNSFDQAVVWGGGLCSSLFASFFQKLYTSENLACVFHGINLNTDGVPINYEAVDIVSPSTYSKPTTSNMYFTECSWTLINLEKQIWFMILDKGFIKYN
jgi:hypothetical protein